MQEGKAGFKEDGRDGGKMISDNEGTRAQKLIWVPPLTTAGRAEECVVFFFFFLIILFIFGCAESPLLWDG